MYTHGIYLTIFISTYTTQMWEDKGTQNRQAYKYKLTHAHRYKWAYEHINAHTCRNTKTHVETQRHKGTYPHVWTFIQRYTQENSCIFKGTHPCNNTHMIIYIRLVYRCIHMHKQMLTPTHTLNYKYIQKWNHNTKDTYKHICVYTYFSWKMVAHTCSQTIYNQKHSNTETNIHMLKCKQIFIHKNAH